MSVNNELIWEKSDNLHIGFVKKLRLLVATNKDDIIMEDIFDTLPVTQINDNLSKNKQSSNVQK